MQHLEHEYFVSIVTSIEKLHYTVLQYLLYIILVELYDKHHRWIEDKISTTEEGMAMMKMFLENSWESKIWERKIQVKLLKRM